MISSNLKYVLKTIGLFLLISFVADKLVYLVFNKISDKVYSGQGIGKVNQFLKTKNNYNLIIFGSSRANHNIDPDAIDKLGFNMGIDGKKIAYAASLIKLLPKEKKQLVLLHIDPQNVFSNKYIGRDIKALLPKYNRIKNIKSDIDQLNMQNVFQTYYWSLSYNDKAFSIIKNYLRPKYDYTKYNGFDPITVSSSQRKIFSALLQQSDSVSCQDHFKVNNIYGRKLKEIKSFCDKYNKTLILFTSPVYSDKCKEDNIQLATYLKQEKLTYLDFTTYFKNNKDLINWKDHTHLSNVGAQKFTTRIAQQLKSL